MSSHRVLVTAATAALAGAALAACGGDTSILLRITRDDTIASPPSLHLAIAPEASGQVLAPSSADAATVRVPTYVDSAAPADRIDVSGRDLKTRPYELLLRPSSSLGGDAGLALAAAGYATSATDGRPTAFGAVDHAVHFVSGDELVYEITLSATTTVTADPGRTSCGTVGGASPAYLCKGGCARIAGGALWIGALGDVDCDGDAHGSDCDDYDWTVNHAATDLCNNGKNDDCVGGVDDGVDRDGDGFTPCQGDCVDNPAVAHSAQIHPGAADDPHDGLDNDCSGKCDESDDQDADTYTRSGHRTGPPNPIDRSCAAATGDCNDHDPHINPGVAEVDGNGIDDDCNGTCDTDADGDLYTAPASIGAGGFVEPPDPDTAHCAAAAAADCDDDPARPENGTPANQIHPGAPELCDAVDDNCNGQCDEGLDPDGDGFTVCGTLDPKTGACTYVGSPTCPGAGAACDCAENKSNIYPGGPGPELCDGYDESCDGILFAADSPCFGVDSGNVCRVGSRACNDTAPPGGFGTCTLTTTPAPMAACNLFGTCATDPDPAACIGRGLVNPPHATCQAQLDRTTTPPAMCPAPPATYTYLLPAINGNTACSLEDWAIVGGTVFGAWHVGLADPTATGAPGRTVAGACQVDLVVTQVGGVAGASMPPPPVTFLVVAARATGGTILVVDLAGVVNGDCPDGPALSCNVSNG